MYFIIALSKTTKPCILKFGWPLNKSENNRKLSSGRRKSDGILLTGVAA